MCAYHTVGAKQLLFGSDAPPLLPLLPRAANGGFGKVEATYQVRFGPAALGTLLKVRISPVDISTTRLFPST